MIKEIERNEKICYNTKSVAPYRKSYEEGARDGYDMKSNRLEYVDVAKGIGIICTVIGHAFTGTMTAKVIYTFHMPMFFFISGYLYHEKSTKELFVKSFKRLLVPYITTCLCFLGYYIIDKIVTDNISLIEVGLRLHGLAALYGIGSNSKMTISFLPDIRIVGVLWFLLAMFVAQIVFNWLVKKRFCPLFLSVGILAGLSYVTAQWFFLPWSIQPALGALIFMYAGYIVQQKDWMYVVPRKHKLLMIPMAAIWLVSMRYGTCNMVSNQYKTSLTFFGYSIPALSGAIVIIAGICGSMFVLWLSTLIAKYIKPMSALLGYTGRESLVILCLHKLELNYVPTSNWASHFFESDTIQFAVLLIVMKMAVIYLGLFLVRRIPVFSLAFYGTVKTPRQIRRKKRIKRKLRKIDRQKNFDNSEKEFFELSDRIKDKREEVTGGQ